MPKDINAISHRLSNIERKVHKLESESSAPRQQCQTGVAPADTTGNKDTSAAGEMSFAPHVKPTPNYTAQSNYPWYKTINGWKALLEVIGIPFAIGYAIVTFCQWRDLRHNFETEQRSWIRVKHAQFGKIAENTVIDGWPLTVANVGKTPALKIYAHAIFEVVDSAKPPSFDFSRQHNGVDISTLFPADENTFTAVMGPDIYNSRPVPREDIGELILGHKYICVWGQVLYIDNFGKHWTRYCAWQDFSANHSSSFSAEPCIAWNTVGDGDPPK